MESRPNADWVVREDEAARLERADRLEWLLTKYPESQLGFLIHGGWLSQRLLEEAKYCFVYGQYLATVILATAFVERVLAAEFYARARDDLERASSVTLLREGLDAGLLTPGEFDSLDNVRQLRNPVAHFRRPLAADTVERRAVVGQADPDELVRGDAETVLMAAFDVLRKSAV